MNWASVPGAGNRKRQLRLLWCAELGPGAEEEEEEDGGEAGPDQDGRGCRYGRLKV